MSKERYVIFLKTFFCYAAIIAIGRLDWWFDNYSNYDLDFSALYMLPLVWFALQKNNNRFIILSACIATAIVWFLADLYSRHPASSMYISLWNCIEGFAVFYSLAYLLYRFRMKRIALSEDHKTLVEEQQKLEIQTKELLLINRQLLDANNEFERLAIVAKEIDNAVMITDKHTNFLWINEGFKRFYNLDMAGLKSKFWNKLLYFHTEKTLLPHLNKCLTEKKMVSFESSHDIDGKKIFTHTTLSPILADDGEISRLIAVDSDITYINEANLKIQQEQEKAEKLLLNILPFKIAQELKEIGQVAPKHFDLASILFTDFTGFTLKCEKLGTEEIVNELNFWFMKFDNIIEKYGLEKIKTIGDSYMCAGGIPIENPEHPVDIVLAALEIIQCLKHYNYLKTQNGEEPWTLRIGLHSGDVIAGIIGDKKFAYDVWGDTVNVAARLEHEGQDMKINISEATYLLIRQYFDCTYRGKIEAKNKGKIDMYFVDGIKEEYSYLVNARLDKTPRQN